MRVLLNVSSGFGFDGGHDETHGVDAGGNVIDVPLHQHEVSLDFVRIELALEVTVFDGWDAWLRIPYEIKHQRTSIDLQSPVTPLEYEAIRRNGTIHHRDATYQGPSDLQLLGGHQLADVLFEGDRLTLALGLTIPVGETEDDPFTAGELGQRHLHIQFGSGTVDPLAEVYYGAPLPVEGLSLSAFATGRISLYENHHDYQAPPEANLGVGASYQLLDWLSASAELSAFIQGYGHWDGKRDANSGLFSLSVVLGLGLRPHADWAVRVSTRLPLVNETLASSSEAFETGYSVLLTVAWSF